MPKERMNRAIPRFWKKACHIMMVAWKLAGFGDNVSEFAARGGPKGAKNIRKSFGAPLADPYANSDDEVCPYYVDSALRVICAALLDVENNESSNECSQGPVGGGYTDKAYPRCH
jgi:glutathione S-transferase